MEETRNPGIKGKESKMENGIMREKFLEARRKKALDGFNSTAHNPFPGIVRNPNDMKHQLSVGDVCITKGGSAVRVVSVKQAMTTVRLMIEGSLTYKVWNGGARNGHALPEYGAHRDIDTVIRSGDFPDFYKYTGIDVIKSKDDLLNRLSNSVLSSKSSLETFRRIQFLLKEGRSSFLSAMVEPPTKEEMRKEDGVSDASPQNPSHKGYIYKRDIKPFDKKLAVDVVEIMIRNGCGENDVMAMSDIAAELREMRKVYDRYGKGEPRGIQSRGVSLSLKKFGIESVGSRKGRGTRLRDFPQEIIDAAKSRKKLVGQGNGAEEDFSIDTPKKETEARAPQAESIPEKGTVYVKPNHDVPVHESRIPAKRPVSHEHTGGWREVRQSVPLESFMSVARAAARFEMERDHLKLQLKKLKKKIKKLTK